MPQQKPLTTMEPPSGSRSLLKVNRMKTSTIATHTQKTPRDVAIIDPYEHLYPYKDIVKKETAFYYHEDMEKHTGIDPKHPENSDRHKKTFQYLLDEGVLKDCQIVKGNLASLNEIAMSVERMNFEDIVLSASSSLVHQENFGARNDSIYICGNSVNAFRRAAGCCVDMTVEIAQGKYKNGFALVRPPGHHASETNQNGYCFVNNVATAAKICLDKKLAERILIVDYDVHQGNGTQKIFYESKNVLVFSIHRYEFGKFWPHSPSGDFNKIGDKAGQGYNVNVPLNETGLTNGDYLAIVHHLLLPLANEFQPDLTIISAGYDAVIGDTEGEMLVTPAFYGHLITLLSGFANGKISVCLEGGYCQEMLQLAIRMTIRSLIGYPCQTLDNLELPKDSTIATINNLKTVLRNFWPCFDICPVYNLRTVNKVTDNDTKVCERDPRGDSVDPKMELLYHAKKVIFKGDEKLALNHPELLGNYPPQYEENTNQLLMKLLQVYDWFPMRKVAFYYDEKTLLHSCTSYHLERPERVLSIMEKFTEWKLDQRMSAIPVDDTRDREVEWLLEKMFSHEHMKNIQQSQISQMSDLYINEDSIKSVRAAVSGLLKMLDEILSGSIGSGIAIIRPPGHHCSPNQPGGFCLVNNIAAAANYLLQPRHGCKKVLIIDFDVHHGNGTQKMFYDTKKVLYISIHKFMNGNFYPNSKTGDVTFVGEGEGKGYNVNIPLNIATAGNKEYLTIFYTIILPIAYSYDPEVILVSAGFDAGINDVLGKYKLSPEVFGQFIQLLKPLANGRLVLALEGGYHLVTTSYGMVMCAKALLNDPLPSTRQRESQSALSATQAETFRNDMSRINLVLKQYWPVLNVFKVLPQEKLIDLNKKRNEQCKK